MRYFRQAKLRFGLLAGALTLIGMSSASSQNITRPRDPPGQFTQCWATSRGQIWVMMNGQDSFEGCLPLARQCTNDPRAVVHYESPVAVLIPPPYHECEDMLANETDPSTLWTGSPYLVQ